MVRNQVPIILNNNVKISLHVHSFHHCCCLITEDSFLSAALHPTWFPLPLGMPFSLYLCSDIWCWTTYLLASHLLGLHYLTGLPLSLFGETPHPGILWPLYFLHMDTCIIALGLNCSKTNGKEKGPRKISDCILY